VKLMRSKHAGRRLRRPLILLALAAHMLVIIACGGGLVNTGPSEEDIRATVAAENAATDAAIPPTEPPAEPTSADAASPVANTTTALNATSNSAVNVQSGPLSNCDVIATWPASQAGTLLARVNNPDGSVYYKAVAPGTTNVGYVFAGQNGANFTVQGDPNSLPLDTTSACAGGTDRAANPSSPTLSAPPTAPVSTPVDCGDYGDGGYIPFDDYNTCTYVDELYDLCGNVRYETGPLDPSLCSTVACGNYGDGGCDPEIVIVACAGPGTFETIEGVCYDLCGNPEYYTYDLTC